MKYGVETARRGWIEKKAVVNTLPLEDFLAALKSKPHAAKGNNAKNKAAKRKSA
jgi:hypothetical protein